MVVHYDDRRHVYFRGVDGRMVPSVTALLKWKGLVPESARTHYATKYLTRGKRIHRATAHEDVDPIARAGEANTMVTRAEEGWITAWRAFCRTTRPTFEAIESRGHWCGLLAGTLDRLAYLGHTDKRTVIDLKTGPKQPWHRLQTAGYLLTHNLPATTPRITVHLKADGTFTIEHYVNAHDHHLMMAYTTEWWDFHVNPDDRTDEESEAADLADE